MRLPCLDRKFWGSGVKIQSFNDLFNNFLVFKLRTAIIVYCLTINCKITLSVVLKGHLCKKTN